MKWQKAKFIPPTDDEVPFWVKAQEGMWYWTNVLSPDGTFFMYAPQNGVELLNEFADDVEPDSRWVKPPTKGDC